MKPLDSWRDYFRRGDSDIFGIIDHAIMVAAKDFPIDFKSRRDRIAELLFSCKVTRCIGCDHFELSIAGDEEVSLRRETVVGDGDKGRDGKAYVIVDEVMRIKEILLNKEDEPDSVLLESLRKLESISMSMDILKDTEIGKAVNGLRRHSSDKISKLAKTLLAEWKELVNKWINTPKEVAGAGWTPEYANLSVVDEGEAFPSPPHDLEIFTPELSEFEFSQILDCFDSDGNPHHGVESKHERRLQSSTRRRPESTNEANVVGSYDKDHQMRREEVDVRPTKHSATDFDEPRRQPKQSREQTVPAIQRKPLVAEQKQKLAGSQQDKLKALDPDAKFESTKRKLQESYHQHENAKRQKTIQVLETIPKQSNAPKPQLKRPARR